MIGLAGAGKGTQAEILVQNYGAVAVATGDLFRNSNDPKIHEIMEKGNLVPDDVVVQLLREELQKHSDKRVILDGYPRNIKQVELFESMLQEIKQAVELVLYLRISHNEFKQRLQKRGRKDDTEEAIEKRWQVFHEQTLPVVQHYQNEGVLAEIDGEGTVKEIAQRIARVIPWQS